MSTRTAADPLEAIDLPVLRGYLIDNGIEVTGDLTATVIAGGRSNLTYLITDGDSSWVLRRPPTAGLTPSAHDVGREYRIVDALQNTAVPVPTSVVNCSDATVMGAPFTVVGYVAGVVLRTQDDLAPLSDEQLQASHDELMRVLVELHAVPFQEVGLEKFGRPDGYVERQVRRWREQWDHVATRELDDVNNLYLALRDRVPASVRASVVHGDYRIDNTLLDEHDSGRVLAVLDWELSTLGDPLTDVAMMCAYQNPSFDYVAGDAAASTSPRWPSAERIAQDYATRSGTDLGDFDFYLGMAYFKLAVIAEGIGARYLAGVGEGAGFANASLAVPGLIAAGLAVVGRS